MRNIKLHTVINRTALNLIGSMIVAFGLFNVHSVSQVTEGGTLGLTLFFQHWLNISPAISSFIPKNYSPEYVT